MSDNKQTEIDPKQEIEIEDLPVDDKQQDEVKGGIGALFVVDVAARR